MLFKNKITVPVLAIALCTGLFLQSCKERTQKEYDRVEVDPVVIRRFDRELFALDSVNPGPGLLDLRNRYGLFYFYYAHDMLSMPYNGDSLFTPTMKMLLNYQPLKKLEYSVDSMYNDLSDIEKGLTDAMGIYHAQFPKMPVPEFITFISEFGYANVTFEKQVGIGLDMYMNKVFSDRYHYFEFPEYMIRKLQREYILPNAIKALGNSKYDGQIARDKRFLTAMLFEGKIRYFAKALLPEVHDSLLMGYTAAQLKWVEDNEQEIWAHFGERDLLYKEEQTQYMRYLNDGPFTSADGVPQDSAPAIGAWAGWKIIQAYMRNNPDVTLQQLMEEKDYDKIMKLSRYKP